MKSSLRIEKLERENESLISALREIVACGLNCRDALDEAEQMESIAERALAGHPHAGGEIDSRVNLIPSLDFGSGQESVGAWHRPSDKPKAFSGLSVAIPR